MIVVGLIVHGAAPAAVPDLEGLARVVLRVNGRGGAEPTPWLGFGANHNRVIDAHGDAEWYVALNADVEIDAAQLGALLEAADRHGYALVGPLRDEPWGNQGGPTEQLPTPAGFLRSTIVPGRIGNREPASPARPVVDSPWVGGSCLAIRGDLLQTLRFDERYFMYFEDIDLCRRATHLGARVGVCTTVTVKHAVGWRHDDPLRHRRGVEYARSAALYARSYGHSPHLMRLAGATQAASRTFLPGRPADASAASRAVLRGFLRPRPGLRELAEQHNERHRVDPAVGR